MRDIEQTVLQGPKAACLPVFASVRLDGVFHQDSDGARYTRSSAVTASPVVSGNHIAPKRFAHVFESSCQRRIDMISEGNCKS